MNRRDQFLLEIHQTNVDSLGRMDTLIYCHTDAASWCFHDKDSWNAMILVVAREGTTLNRDTFTRSALVNVFKDEQLPQYIRIP